MSEGRGELESFESSLDKTFRRLGLPDPILMSRLTAEWDEMAGEPWKGRSRPLSVSGKTLVVEASAPSMVAFLKYGEKTLLETLERRLGPGVIERIEVRAPRH